MKKLIFTALLSLSLVSQEQNIFYKDADIKTFAQDIALLTDKTIILDPRVKGVISIYSDAPLDSESIWEVFISTMEVQGYNVLKDGNIYRVIPSQEGVKNFSEDGPLAGSIGSEVIKLRFSSAKDIVNAVKPIVGVRSYIVALQNDREVLIADDADNIKRVRDIIRNLDSELDTSISDFKLKNLSSISFSSAAAAANFKPLFVWGAVGISIVFSIEPLPESIVIIPQPPCSLISFCLSVFWESVSKG